MQFISGAVLLLPLRLPPFPIPAPGFGQHKKSPLSKANDAFEHPCYEY
jgi:hypothetical protein